MLAGSAPPDHEDQPMPAFAKTRSRLAALAALAALGATVPAVAAEDAAAQTRGKKIDVRKLVRNLSARKSPDLDPRSVVRRPRIIGGGQAQAAAFPFIAAVIRSDRIAGNQSFFDRQYCGGTLIHPRLVLTAAHCIVDKRTGAVKPAGDIQVLLGARNLASSPGQKYNVAFAQPHPDYRGASKTKDVALLYLETAATSTPVVSLMDPAMSLQGGDQAVTQGWGRVSEDGEPDVYAEELQTATVPIVPFDRCNALYGGRLDATMMCAGYDEGKIDSCEGDSGGPIAVRDATGAWRQVGVVSWGDGCAQRLKPGVYALLANAENRAFVDDGLRKAAAGTVPTAGTTTAPPADQSAPALQMTLTPGVVRRGGITTARFRLDEQATIKIAVLRRARRNGRVRLVRLPGLIRRQANVGLSELRFRPRKVKRGATYLLAIQATDAAGNRTPILGARFRVR
jgi:Trypsin